MSEVNDKVPLQYESPVENKWAHYFWSLLEAVHQRGIEKRTYFIDPRQQEIARDLLYYFSAVKGTFFGGYEGAERVRVSLLPRSLAEKSKEELVTCLEIRGKFPENVLSHRDFLGSILGLGIKREVIGDIIYHGGSTAWIFSTPEISEFIARELYKIGRYEASVEQIGLEKIEEMFTAVRFKEIKGTVPSLRLDAVAGLGFGLSRSRIAPLIKGGQVKVNYQVINQPSKTIKSGDLISLTGKGRIKVAEISGETRKGRVHILLNKMI